MSELTANIRLRPTRIGFLVRPYDKKAIRQIMRLNACLWGGLHNPIIPIFRGTPKEWKHDKYEYLTGYEIAKGYIRFFEPDVYVETEAGLLQKIGLTALIPEFSVNNPVINIDQFMTNEYGGIMEPYFGQNVFDILKHTYVNERRFQLRDVEPALMAQDKSDIFAEACMGVYPEGDEIQYLPKYFRDVFKPEEVDSSPETWLKVFDKGFITPLRVTFNHIAFQRYWHHGPIIMYLIPTNQLT